MTQSAGVTDGRVVWSGHETWNQVVGDLTRDAPPLVVIHGGPGTPHDYLISIADLAENGRPCITCRATRGESC